MKSGTASSAAGRVAVIVVADDLADVARRLRAAGGVVAAVAASGIASHAASSRDGASEYREVISAGYSNDEMNRQ